MVLCMGPARGWGGPIVSVPGGLFWTRRMAGVGFRRVVLDLLVRRGTKMFCPSRKKHCSVGVPIDLSTPDVFCLSSTRHRKIVQNHQATKRERERERSCKTKACWGLGRAGSVSPSKSGPEPPLCILLLDCPI